MSLVVGKKFQSLLTAASLFVIVVLSSTSNAFLQEQRQQQQQEPAPEPYSFSYSAQSIGGLSSHQESGDGSGRVTGFYTIQGDDGRERRVDYVADENGYRASVQTNEIGTRTSKGAGAGADYQVQPPSAGQLEAAKVSFEQYQQLEEAHANEQARIQNRQSSASRDRSVDNQQQQQQQRVGSSFRQQQGGSSGQLVANNNRDSLPASRQSREPDARDVAVIKNSLEFQQRAGWQNRATDNQVLQGRGARLGYPQQQLELQFQQQANQLTDQDYPRQQATAFDNTSQFLIDEPTSQPQFLPPQLQPQQLQPQPQQLPQLQQQPQPLPQQPLLLEPNDQYGLTQSNTNKQVGSSGDYQQQQQDNIINEPVEVDGPVEAAEVPRQPEPIFTRPEVQQLPQQQQPLQFQPQVNTIRYNESSASSRPIAPSGFVSINLNQSGEKAQENGDQEQVSIVNNEPKQTIDNESNYGLVAVTTPTRVEQQQEVQQTVGEQPLKQSDAWNSKLVSSDQQQQQQQPQREIPNSVNQIIENFARQPQISITEGAIEVTSRPVAQVPSNSFAAAAAAAKGQQQQQQQEVFVSEQPQRQPSRFVSSNVVRPTFAPATTSFSSIIKQTTTTLAPTTTTAADYAEEQPATTITAQLAYTTPARFYQPTTSVQPIISYTTTAAPTTTTTTTRPIQSTSTTRRPLQQQQQQRQQQKQQQFAGVKRGNTISGNSPLAAIFRKQQVLNAGTQTNQQQAGYAQSIISSRPTSADRVITTTRAPIRLPPPLAPIPAREQQQQQQQVITYNQQRQRQQQPQPQPQRVSSEAPYSIYSATEQPGVSSVSYASRNKTASLAPFANQLQQQQQRFNQLQNNNNIRFNSSSTEVARRPVAPIELQTNNKTADSEFYTQANRPAEQPQQQQQQWKTVKGGRAKSGLAKQFWQQNGNQTSRFQAPTSTTRAEDYATSLAGYGNRVMAASRQSRLPPATN